jgi:hypothetical protein
VIETAHPWGEKMGLAVWNEDEAGPYQAIPQPGSSWEPEGKPARQPHEYIRGGTAKMLTLLHPSTGEVRVKGVTSSRNAVLHLWLKEQISSILSALPEPPEESVPEERRALWERWQEGLWLRLCLPEELGPLWMLLILDNLAGHKSEPLVTWFLANGVMPIYTPVGGSWLNMAESIQRILTRRALSGQHPTRGDHLLVGSDGACLGSGAHALCLGRQAQGAPRPGAPAPSRSGRFGCVHASGGQLPWACPTGKAMRMTSDPLDGVMNPKRLKQATS